MHRLYKPGKAPDVYDLEEYCPHCDSCIPVLLDNDDHQHYEFSCPVCGERLMLCTLCHDDYGDVCDWCEATGCFLRRNATRKEVTP